MTPRDPEFEAIVSELANALQVAAPLSTTLRIQLADQAQDAITLEAALDRAVRAVRQLREKGGAER